LLPINDYDSVFIGSNFVNQGDYMPHQRVRFLEQRLRAQGSFWPIVGLLGPRQVGKTTILRDQMNISNFVTFDEEEYLEAASNSPKVFLSRQETPLILDEIQKVPKIFDSLKAAVDRKKRPGQYYITGSVQFSAKLGIRESLTGRIGMSYLLPLTIQEALGLPFNEVSMRKRLLKPTDVRGKSKVELSDFTHHMDRGGMPVPMFLRDQSKVHEYWSSWLDATIYRDVPRLIKGRYDADFALSLLRKMASIMLDGEMPTLKHFSATAARVRTYLQAFQDVFLVRKIMCHEEGVGKEVWIFFDNGLARYLMKNSPSDGATLTLSRHLLWSETSAQLGFTNQSDERTYYKSAKGTIVDWIWNGIPMKVALSSKQTGWEERSLEGAMKTLNSDVGYLIAPIDKPLIVKKGIGILPWHYWSTTG
jgi:predicted AAA+ superfamily ATPase